MEKNISADMPLLFHHVGGNSRLVNTVALSPDGEIVVSGERNGTVRMWEIGSGQCLHTLSRQTVGVFPVAAVAFRPDGRLFATSSPDNEINVWDVESGQRRR